MIPLRDTVPRVHPPFMVVAIIVVTVGMFFLELGLDSWDKAQLFHLYGVVPLRFTDPAWALRVGFPDHSFLPFFSYIFLHSGWFHLIMNMWMLWIFGDNIEDVTGHFWFLFFYLLCGGIAAAVHFVSDVASISPVIGASGAVAGVMGAYLVLYPHGKVQVLVPIFLFPLFFRIPSILFLGFWIGSQIFAGLTTANAVTSSVAVWAHIGGFFAGMLFIFLFRGRGRCYYCYNHATRDYDKPTSRNPK